MVDLCLFVLFECIDVLLQKLIAFFVFTGFYGLQKNKADYDFCTLAFSLQM